jgi:hypothetical protein
MFKKCRAITKNGTPCKGRVIKGSEYCTFHDPLRAEAIHAGQVKGAATALIPRIRLQSLPLRSTGDILDACEDALSIARADGLKPDKLIFLTVQILRVALDAQKFQFVKGEGLIQDDRLALLDEIIAQGDDSVEAEEVFLEDLPPERQKVVEGWLQESRVKCAVNSGEEIGSQVDTEPTRKLIGS